jgi:hypothetical protein
VSQRQRSRTLAFALAAGAALALTPASAEQNLRLGIAVLPKEMFESFAKIRRVLRGSMLVPGQRGRDLRPRGRRSKWPFEV